MPFDRKYEPLTNYAEALYTHVEPYLMLAKDLIRLQ